MIIEASILVEAPPEVVFRFYRQLDHLRFVSAERRREWCVHERVEANVGREYEVRIRQGRHAILLRIRTVRADAPHRIEDEFLNWPLKGARHIQSFEAKNDGRATLITEVNRWNPPWYARTAVKRHEWEQTRFFEEKLANGKRVIETVYASRGPEAFVTGVADEVAPFGIEPVVIDDE